jgi:FkbM family methyltransferase
MSNIEIDHKLAYDIGAFSGDTVGMIRSLGYDKVVCFEPNPEIFSSLYTSHKGDENVVPVNLAVSEKSDEIVKMYLVPGHPYLSSLENSWLEIPRHNLGQISEIEVKTISLDDYIKSTGKIPAYIKVDAEGHEISIFKGLTLKPQMISFEWISEFYEKNITCLQMMKDLGFTKFEICFTENMPQGNNLNFEECCDSMKSHNETDTDRKIWGNIWCS